MKKELSKRQAEVLRFIHEHTYTGTPSYREISEYFGFNLKATSDHIERLEKKGHIKRTGKHNRMEIL